MSGWTTVLTRAGRRVLGELLEDVEQADRISAGLAGELHMLLRGGLTGTASDLPAQQLHLRLDYPGELHSPSDRFSFRLEYPGVMHGPARPERCLECRRLIHPDLLRCDPCRDVALDRTETDHDEDR